MRRIVSVSGCTAEVYRDIRSSLKATRHILATRPAVSDGLETSKAHYSGGRVYPHLSNVRTGQLSERDYIRPFGKFSVRTTPLKTPHYPNVRITHRFLSTL